MTQEHIGFAGLGLMGHGMAKNIVTKGYPLTVTAHRNRSAVDDLTGRGAVEASLADLAAALAWPAAPPAWPRWACPTCGWRPCSPATWGGLCRSGQCSVGQ